MRKFTYECTFSHFLVPQWEHTHDTACKNEQADEPVHGVVTDVFDAACAEEHIQWNIQLHQADKEPRRDSIRRPKQQQWFEHVKDTVKK